MKTGRIEQHWDDMLRVAGSLKLGTIHASDLIRTILKSDRPSGLAQAIIEAGRINKTLYLLNYINDEDYRRRILTQLNRGEGRHSVARAICYGQKGEIRKRYRDGQEDQQGIFFDGQVFDAYVFVSKLIKKAKKSIILIDNYIDESVLTLLTKRPKKSTVIIYTKNISKKLQLDLDKHNEQYAPIEIKTFNYAHDRFLILDNIEIYHIGASLKDLGKKWFAFSRLDKNSVLEVFKRLKLKR